MLNAELKTLCADLQCRGLRIASGHSGRLGGAGPAEGQTIILDGIYLNVPSVSWYVASSPYRIEKNTGGWLLYKDDVPVQSVAFPAQPSFYEQSSPGGIPYQQFALLHGRDCFASTIYQGCKYWDTPLQCKFCGIGLSLKKNMTMLKKDPADLGRAAALAAHLDSATHVTLTTGAWQDEPSGLDHLCACVREIKKQAGLAVHAQVHPPRDLQDLEILKTAGVDTLGIHIEVADAGLLHHMAPAKAQLGLAAYTTCWQRAVELFGTGQVSSFLIAGCGETRENFLAMAEHIARLGVYPYVLPLRPIPDTPLADRKPPETAVMVELYVKTAALLQRYGLASRVSKAGCVRCGACSCIQLFEEK